MKNPLYKRIPREMKRNLGKNIAMLLFLTLTIGFCSGYFIATGSLASRLAENYDRFTTEDGHFTLTKEIDDTLIQVIHDHQAEVYPLFYKDKTVEHDHVLRIYALRQKVNRMEMYSGTAPAKDDEIAIDRLYARNNGISMGDHIRISGKSYRVTGFSVVPDYTSLYKKNTDFMFDALDFCVAFVTQTAFDQMDEGGLEYNYAWTYRDRTLNEQQKHDAAEAMMNAMADAADDELDDIKDDILQQLFDGTLTLDESTITEARMPPILTDFIPSESNSAINMATEDVGGDKIIVMWLLYLTIAVIALATAITARSTVEQEATVIGTLRASGYRKAELVGHYMIISLLTTFVSAVIGNVIGYTFMNSVCASMYYGSYSFPVYTPHINAEAFVWTTVGPVVIVLAVNLLMLMRLLSLPPLQFLRRELKAKKKGKSIPLKMGTFRMRFCTRIILRNKGAYLVLFIGVTFANLLLMFSLIWTPLLDAYRDTVLDNVIAEYQYMLRQEVETDEPTAEKFAVYALKNDNDEDITIYGIQQDSQYIKGLDFSGDKVYFSSAYEEKYGVQEGTDVHFSEKFSSKEYTLTDGGTYHYPPALCVFMGLDHFREVFDTGRDDFSGYFCNKKIEDIDDVYIATVIGRSDLTMSADQLENSVGFVRLFAFFAIAVYILMIYILSRMITERNARSVSVLKILGYRNAEISGLYNASTGVVVVLSMLISMPLIGGLIRLVYFAMMQRYKGWLSFSIAPEIYPEMFAIGCLCFLATYLLEMRRVRRIALNEAVKDVE